MAILWAASPTCGTGQAMIAGKEVIFSAQSYGPDGVFHQVVVNFDFTSPA